MFDKNWIKVEWNLGICIFNKILKVCLEKW